MRRHILEQLTAESVTRAEAVSARCAAREEGRQALGRADVTSLAVPVVAILGACLSALAGLAMSGRHAVFALLPAVVGAAPLLFWWATGLVARARWAVALLFVAVVVGFSLNLALLSSPEAVAAAATDAAAARLPQQLLKLLLMCGAFLAGVAHLSMTRRMLESSAGLIVLAYCAWTALTIPGSGNPLFSAAAAFGLLSLILFVPAIVIRFEAREIQVLLVVAVSIIIVANWLVYLLLPEVGREFNAGAVRFVGLYGTPNGAGQMAGVAMIVGAACFFVRRECGPVPRWVVHASVFLILAATPMLILTLSRGTMAALLVVAAMPVLRRTRMTGLATGLGIIAATVISQIPTQSYQDVLSALARSGHVQEVLTLTGRLDIWRQVVNFIGRSPIFGYGYGYGQSFLRDNLVLPWNETTTSAHNMILHSALDVGLGTVFLIILMVIQFVRYFRRPIFLRDAILIFVVVVGITEDGIAITTNPLLLLWLLSLFYGEARHAAPEPAYEDLDMPRHGAPGCAAPAGSGQTSRARMAVDTG